MKKGDRFNLRSDITELCSYVEPIGLCDICIANIM